MRHLFETLYRRIKDRLNIFAENTAEALEARDHYHLFRNAVVAVMTLFGIVGFSALLIALLYLGRKVLLPLIGTPLLIAILIASYFEGKKDVRLLDTDKAEKMLLQERSESVYEYVRDAMYLVICAVSDYTELIRPNSPSSIETNTRFYVRNGVAVFQFNILTASALDSLQLRRDLERVLGQKLRAQELPGIPSKLVTHEGHTYLPLQILAVSDCGSSINVDVVFANENSIPLLEAKKRVQMEQHASAFGNRGIADDEF